MSLSDTEVREFLDLLATLGRRSSLRDPIANAVAESSLGAAQVHALLWLRRDGALTMGALAQRIGVTDRTITGTVDRLERDAFVKRERSAQDRRVVHVVLAERGQELAAQLDEMITRNVKLFLSMLDERDRSDLVRIVHNLVAKTEALPPSSSSNTL